MSAPSTPGGKVRVTAGVPAFAASYAPPDHTVAPALLAAASRRADAEARIDGRARRLVESIRVKDIPGV